MIVPKSSPVAITYPFFVLSTEFISVPSEHGGNIPYTGQPNTHVQLYHFSSRLLEAPRVSYLPLSKFQNKISYEVQFDINELESSEKSRCVIVE